MKAAAAFLVLAGLGVLAGRGLADTLPVPTLPTVTASVPVPKLPAPPKVRVPTVPTQTGPAPTVSAPSPTVSAPSPSAPKLTQPSLVPSSQVDTKLSAAGASLLGSGASSSSRSGSSYSSAGSSRSSGSSGSSDAKARETSVQHFQSSRRWIGTSGPTERRTTTLKFVLPRAARVIFTVKQLSPVCRLVGRFSVRGHAGLNRVRFNGRVGRKQLGPGTYRIVARTQSGRSVQRLVLVVVDGGAPSRAELMALRALNVCAATRGTASADTSTGLASGVLPELVERSVGPREQPSATGPSDEGTKAHPGGVLGTAVEKAAEALRPFLVALLALAILLLGLASLPEVAVPATQVNDVLTRHRAEIAGLGAAALVAAVVLFLLG